MRTPQRVRVGVRCRYAAADGRFGGQNDILMDFPVRFDDDQRWAALSSACRCLSAGLLFFFFFLFLRLLLEGALLVYVQRLQQVVYERRSSELDDLANAIAGSIAVTVPLARVQMVIDDVVAGDEDRVLN